VTVAVGVGRKINSKFLENILNRIRRFHVFF
jgi:hypothetical protein